MPLEQKKYILTTDLASYTEMMYPEDKKKPPYCALVVIICSLFLASLL